MASQADYEQPGAGSWLGMARQPTTRSQALATSLAWHRNTPQALPAKQSKIAHYTALQAMVQSRVVPRSTHASKPTSNPHRPHISHADKLRWCAAHFLAIRCSPRASMHKSVITNVKQCHAPAHRNDRLATTSMADCSKPSPPATNSNTATTATQHTASSASSRRLLSSAHADNHMDLQVLCQLTI